MFGTVHTGSAPRARGTGTSWRCRRRSVPAQPRVRGERDVEALVCEPEHGSAPRARGTVKIRGIHLEIDRLSPACAGNGLSSFSLCLPSAAQPRVRGEREGRRRECVSQGGSARVRGERFIGARLRVGGCGSAPRARGTAHFLDDRLDGGRLSPACAGNGVSAAEKRCKQPAQPRVRGERGALMFVRFVHAGSAPRARGTGATTESAASLCSAQPRVRGERRRTKASASVQPGSAPRARGTDAIYARMPDGPRLSPACAGNGRAP